MKGKVIKTDAEWRQELPPEQQPDTVTNRFPILVQSHATLRASRIFFVAFTRHLGETVAPRLHRNVPVFAAMVSEVFLRLSSISTRKPD